MLRVTSVNTNGTLGLKLEGKLSGPWVDELQHCWAAMDRGSGPHPKVNLEELSFLDGRGKGLLLRMEREGARFVKCPAFIRQVLGRPGGHQARRKKIMKKESEHVGTI